MLLGLEVGIGLIALIGLLVWLGALIDALRRPSAQWEMAGQSQIVWIVVILFASLVGSIAYLLIARPRLEAQAA